jgi:hypothetical protein
VLNDTKTDVLNDTKKYRRGSVLPADTDRVCRVCHPPLSEVGRISIRWIVVAGCVCPGATDTAAKAGVVVVAGSAAVTRPTAIPPARASVAMRATNQRRDGET